MSGTDMHERDGFYIHGGTSCGSAGCIDLTKYNDEFHRWLRAYGKPIELHVMYGFERGIEGIL